MTPLPPGSTLGVFGSGQLGRMFALAARRMGYRVRVYSPDADTPAGQVSDAEAVGEYEDRDAVAAFCRTVQAVTFEFENVPATPLAFLVERLAPGLRALETAQDRVKEKRFAESLGGRTAPFAAVETPDDLARAVDRIGAPGILKTAREGYDGKGQWRLESARDADSIRLPHTTCVYEGLVQFTAEFSVILVRGHDGEVCRRGSRGARRHLYRW